MGKLTWLELKTQLRSPLLLAVALAAALIYAVPEALNPALGWAQFGVQVAAWSSILLSLAYFYALVRALGKDAGGTGEMVWARPVASSPYIFSKLVASAGVLILLWLLAGLAAGAVRIATMGAPTASEAARYLLFGAVIALPNLVFMAAALLFLTALTGRLLVVYGAGLLLWLIAALLPRDTALGTLYPFSVPPSTFSEAAGFGGFWQVLLQNRLYSLLTAAILVLAAGYALSRRRRAPERRTLYLILGGLPLLVLFLALLVSAPSPAQWLERSRATWQAREPWLPFAGTPPSPGKRGGGATSRALSFPAARRFAPPRP